MKKCTKCGEEKPATLEYFHARPGYKTMFRSECRLCRNAQAKITRRKNLKRHNKIKADWFKNNPDKAREINRKKNIKRRGMIPGSYSESDVFETYGTNCTWCDMPINLNAPRRAGLPGWRSGLQLDHFISTSNGGPDTLENIRPTHGWCNNARRNNDVEVIK